MTTDILIEYSTTVVIFFLLMFIWPRTIFAFYFRGKNGFFQLFSCIGISTIFITLFCSLLGYFDLLQTTILPTFLLVSFLIFFIINSIFWIRQYKNTRKVRIPFISKIIDAVKPIINKFKNKNFSKSDLLNWICNIAIVFVMFVSVMYFISYIIDQPENVSADMWRHEDFIKDMFNGEFFPNGIYPFGMHSIIYTLCITFGMSLHQLNWSFNIIASILFIISLYVLFNKLFKHRLSVLFALFLVYIVCSTASTKTIQLAMLWEGVHRICWTLPEELVIWTVFISPICILNILKSEKSIKDKSNVANLLLLGLSVGASLCVHYYTSAIQFVFCACVALLYISRFSVQKFFGLLISCISGCASAIISLMIGFAKSGSWSFSIYWAINIQEADYGSMDSIVFVQPSDYSSTISHQAISPLESFSAKLFSLFNDGFIPLFGYNFQIPFILLFLFGLGVLIYLVVKKGFDSKIYLSFLLVFLTLFILYSSDLLDMPRTVEGYRLVLPMYICLITISTLPVELIVSNLIKTWKVENKIFGTHKIAK